ncbi:MAG TPA: hypothetical protein VGD75_17205, partial [Bradyrhizobium sp.]
MSHFLFTFSNNNNPHPEERVCARLEGWLRVQALHPSFETRPEAAPQDEVERMGCAPRHEGFRLLRHQRVHVLDRLDKIFLEFL